MAIPSGSIQPVGAWRIKSKRQERINGILSIDWEGSNGQPMDPSFNHDGSGGGQFYLNPFSTTTAPAG
jgi:hypothetical protein